MKQIFVHKNILKKIFFFVLILVIFCGNVASQESDIQNQVAEKDVSNVEEKTVSQIVEKKLILKKVSIICL